MERLTNSIDYCHMMCDFGKAGDCFFEDKSKCYEKNIHDKLREYEQAEEQGLLHKAPIPDGTIIYLWAENDDDEMIIHSESYLYGVTEFLYGKYGEDFWDSEEQALAKMKGE